MAAHRNSISHGGARRSENHEYTVHHFVKFLDCCKALLDNDQQGELPLMGELFVFRCPSTAKTSYCAEFHWSSESETMNHVHAVYEKSRKPRGMQTSRRTGREQYLGSGASKPSASKYALQANSSLFLAKRNEQDIRGRRASQVGYIEQKSNVSSIGIEDSSVAIETLLNNHSLNLDDDEFSLQHWMNISLIQNGSSKRGHWDHKLPNNARRLWTAENLIRARGAASPSGDVYELTNRAFRKSLPKKKRLTSSKNNKQSCQFLSSSLLNSHRDCFLAHNRPSGFSTQEGLVFVEQGHTNKGKEVELHKMSDHLHDFQSAFLTENSQRPGTIIETWRSQNMPTTSSSIRKRTQGFLQSGKQSSLDDDLILSELPGSRYNKPYQRLISKDKRKTFPDSSRNSSTRGLSDFSSRKYGPNTNVYLSPRRDSMSDCAQKVQNVKERGVELLQTEDSTSGKYNKTKCVEASEKHENDCDGKSVSPDRSISETVSREVQQKMQKDDGLARNSQAGDNVADSGERTRSLSEKYRPKVLKDLIGQNLVAHALSNAISNGKVAPVYLFQGPPGTGKTSAARIFAAALNCLTSGEKKPCGLCSVCTALASGKTSGFWELDAASHNGVVHIKELMEAKFSSTTDTRYKIIILDECHVFSHDTWGAVLKILEEPPGNAVIILITTHPSKLPLTVVSRCQKFHFLQIKHSDIVDRLNTVMRLEKLDAEPGALNLIASKSDGSLRDAEIVLDQVSLLERRITLDTIHRLVGSVSDDKLLSLLDMALRSDTLSMVQRTRDLLDSGVEPLDLMFQLSTLITNILAGSYIPMNTNPDDTCSSMHALSDLEMKRLQTALRILAEAENQLKATSQYRATWLTAALLHIGPSFQPKSRASASSMTHIASSATQSVLKNRKTSKKKVLEVKRGGRKRSVPMEWASKGKSYGFDTVRTNGSKQLDLESGVHSVDYSGLHRKPTLVTQFQSFNEGVDLHVKIPSNLQSLRQDMLKCCRPHSLRQLLREHSKIVAVSFSAVKVVVHLKIEKQDPKLEAGFYNTCIVNSFKKALGLPVELEISLPPALCSAGFKDQYAASCVESVMQSTSNRCVDCKSVELQNEGVILDVKSIRSHRNESEILSPTCYSTGFSPAGCASPVTNFILHNIANKSASNLSVVKRHFGGAEVAMPQQHSAKGALTSESRCPIKTAVDYCLQNLKISQKLQLETLKHRRWLRRKPLAGLHAQKCSCDCIFAILKHGNSSQVCNHEKNLVIEPQLKFRGLLCWKPQKSEAEKIEAEKE